MENPKQYPAFHDLVCERYSCRNYTSEPVSRETILSILEAARLAPSACNRQPWKFIVIENDSPLKKTVIEAYDRPWVADIQAFIIACGIHDDAWHRSDGKDHTDIDVAIAVEHICLAAAALGLGSCWICNFDVDKITAALSLPDGVEPIAIIPLGYPQPTEKTPRKIRKQMDEIVAWGKF